ncbi:MAG: glycosyltransferase family 1 protein [Micrococcales bacterium]|nr:glycosyltransferase family 1 protein [Micrococcales bacterium]NBT46285.1 glycosyltransferase family 1 protein [Actinomycetota bacterium]NBY44328.1 glycosyltransferase family 1 protein [Micrococcales bacterium]
MKTLHFDARFIRLDHHDGISRFSVELIKHLTSKVRVVAIIHDRKQLNLLPKGIEFLEANSPESLAEFFIAKKLNRAGATHVYSPMQVMGSAGRKYRLALTLHDLIYYRHRRPPQDLNLFIRVIWRLYHLTYIPQRILLNRADEVVTVSETSKKLIEKHHLTRKPVSVIYNSSSVGFKSGSRTFPKEINLVYIGSFMPYKNVETLIRATGKSSNTTLHLLSKITPDRELALSELAKTWEAKVVFHRGVTDEQYLTALNSAFALVTASKDEGFGIPLVEAMSQATPVIVSDLEIFREVAGEAGNYFKPDDPDTLVKKITYLKEKQTWEANSKAALEQAKKFSWESSAKKLLEVLASK